MRYIWLILLGLCLQTLAQVACARDSAGILSQSYFEDKSNRLTFAQVQHEQFTPYKDVLAGGYKSGVYWLKLRLAASNEETVIKIRPPYNEEIEIFDTAKPVARPLVGAKHPWRANDVEGLSFNFLLPESDKDRDVYLRIKSARTYMVYVEAVSLEDYQRSDRKEQSFAVGYTAFTLILAAGLFLVWLINPEMVLGVFTIQQFLAFLHAFFHVGLGAMWLDGYVNPASINYAWCLVVVVYPLVAFIANKLLLAEYGLKSAYRKICNGFVGLSFLDVVLFLTGNPNALMLNAILLLVVMVYFGVAPWIGLNLSKATSKSVALPVATLRAYYTFNLIIWAATLVPMLGILSLGEIPLYTLFVYNILSGIVFFFILQYRARALLRLEAERSTILELEAKHERNQREEQGMLMAMLSHEIKTPLSVLKLVVDERVVGSDLEGHANRAMNNINSIVNRCMQLDKLDTKKMQLNRTVFDAREFIEALLRDYDASTRTKVCILPGLMVCADSEVLRVVVANLLENALKYSPADSLIEIEMLVTQNGGKPGASIVMRNAIGPMGAPDPEQVFKKYYRNNRATKITGSGLGLFLVHQLIGVMGGRVTYTSPEDQVQFSIWMPT